MYCVFFSLARYTEPNFPLPSGSPISKSERLHCLPFLAAKLAAAAAEPLAASMLPPPASIPSPPASRGPFSLTRCGPSPWEAGLPAPCSDESNHDMVHAVQNSTYNKIPSLVSAVDLSNKYHIKYKLLAVVVLLQESI